MANYKPDSLYRNTSIVSNQYLDTLNVDDAFLKNNANDSTSGTITAAGFIATGNVSGSSTSSGSFGHIFTAGGGVTAVAGPRRKTERQSRRGPRPAPGPAKSPEANVKAPPAAVQNAKNTLKH